MTLTFPTWASFYICTTWFPKTSKSKYMSFVPRFFMIQSHYPHLHTPRDRLTDIMNSYLLLICISFVPATVSICATLPLWFSKHMQNRIIRLSGLTVLSLIMAGGLFFAFACQNPWFGLSCIAVSSINILLFRQYELLLSTLRCSKCHNISLHLLSVQNNTYELTCSHCGFHKIWKK